MLSKHKMWEKKGKKYHKMWVFMENGGGFLVKIETAGNGLCRSLFLHLS